MNSQWTVFSLPLAQASAVKLFINPHLPVGKFFLVYPLYWVVSLWVFPLCWGISITIHLLLRPTALPQLMKSNHLAKEDWQLLGAKENVFVTLEFSDFSLLFAAQISLTFLGVWLCMEIGFNYTVVPWTTRVWIANFFNKYVV